MPKHYVIELIWYLTFKGSLCFDIKTPVYQGVNSIYQLLLFLFHLFSLTLFLLLCFIVFPKKNQTKISKK